MPQLPKAFEKFCRESLDAKTLGFPTTVAAHTWVEETFGRRRKTSRR